MEQAMFTLISILLVLAFTGAETDQCGSCEELSKYTFIQGLEELPECDYSHCFTDYGRNLNQHTSNEELSEFVESLKATCPDIIATESIGKSVNGSDLTVVVISDNPDEHELGEPEFKYIANMHGNEVVGREVLVNFAHRLCSLYGKHNDEDLTEEQKDEARLITDTVDRIRIHLLFSMNPDGYAAAEKNPSDWMLGRENANKQDLNRDFPDLDIIAFKLEDAFEKNKVPECRTDHLQELTKNFDAAVKKMQPESRAVVAWLRKTPFVLSANLHGGSFVANYPFDTSPSSRRVVSRAPDHEVFKFLATVYAETNTVMSNDNLFRCPGDDEHFAGGITNGARWYPVAGGMQDFNYDFSNDFEITLELGCVKFPEAKDMWKYHYQNKHAILEFARLSLIGVKGIVFQVTTEGEEMPLETARVDVRPVNFENHDPMLSCHDVTTSKDGEFWRLLLPGDYHVTVCKDGFVGKDAECEVIPVTVFPYSGATDIGIVYLFEL